MSPVVSKAQFRRAKAHPEDFGSEWTENVDYEKLPERISTKRDKTKKKKKGYKGTK